jgi:hypothetical protein
MEENYNPKSDIDFLLTLTSILTDQVHILKKEIDFLKNKMGIKNQFNTNDILSDNVQPRFDTIDNFEEDIIDMIDTNDKNDDRNKQTFYTYDYIKNGIKHSSDPNLVNKDGINQVLNTVTGIAPRDLKINSNSTALLSYSIRKFFPPRSSWEKSKHVAMEMLLIHNNGFASSDELRKITGLSKPGFAKHLPSLKRSGLVYRESYKKYALTELGKSIMNKTFGNENRSLY